MEIPTLKCIYCDEVKYLIFFGKSTIRKDGKSGTCKDCIRLRKKKTELQIITNNCPLVPLRSFCFHPSLAKKRKV